MESYFFLHFSILNRYMYYHKWDFTDHLIPIGLKLGPKLHKQKKNPAEMPVFGPFLAINSQI